MRQRAACGQPPLWHLRHCTPRRHVWARSPSQPWRTNGHHLITAAPAVIAAAPSHLRPARACHRIWCCARCLALTAQLACTHATKCNPQEMQPMLLYVFQLLPELGIPRLQSPTLSALQSLPSHAPAVWTAEDCCCCHLCFSLFEADAGMHAAAGHAFWLRRPGGAARTDQLLCWFYSGHSWLQHAQRFNMPPGHRALRESMRINCSVTERA